MVIYYGWNRRVIHKGFLKSSAVFCIFVCGIFHMKEAVYLISLVRVNEINKDLCINRETYSVSCNNCWLRWLKNMPAIQKTWVHSLS